MPLDDYTSILANGAALVPDPRQQLAQDIQIKMARMQIDQAQEAADRQKMFQHDLEGVGQKPDAHNISALMLKYPEFTDKIKSAWDVKEEATKQADLTQLGQIYSPAASGNWDLALKSAQARLDADHAAGNADEQDQAFVDQIKAAASGDESARKSVLTALGTQIAAVSGPEHFATVYGALKGGYTLDAGATRYDENGNVVAQSPFLKTEGGGILERDGHGGSTPAPSPVQSGTPSSPGGDSGFDTAVAFTLKHEGGYNPSDMNGAPVNFGINQGANPDLNVKSLSKDEAAQIYKERYWNKSGASNLPAAMQTPYFDTYIINPSRAQQFLKASGGDPNKFMQLRETWMNAIAAKHPKYAKAYATRNADLRLTMQGQGSDASTGGDSAGTPAAPPGYHWVTPPKPKDAPSGFRWSADGSTLEKIPGGPADDATSFRILTPAEADAQGLDPNTKYQVNDKTGQITPIGGQQRQAKQIPQAVVTKAAPTIDVRDTMARLAGTWKPDFGGHTVLGDNLNTLQRTLGSYSGAPDGMADWWADYQSMDNVVRNQLFGSALTEHEKQAYAATTITPRMDPKQIKERFNRRRAIINAVAARQQNFLKKNGYDPDAVDALFQPLGGEAGGQSASAAPVKVNSVQQAQKLAPGTLYVAPDGKVRRR